MYVCVCVRVRVHRVSKPLVVVGGWLRNANTKECAVPEGGEGPKESYPKECATTWNGGTGKKLE